MRPHLIKNFQHFYFPTKSTWGFQFWSTTSSLTWRHILPPPAYMNGLNPKEWFSKISSGWEFKKSCSNRRPLSDGSLSLMYFDFILYNLFSWSRVQNCASRLKIHFSMIRSNSFSVKPLKPGIILLMKLSKLCFESIKPFI